MIKWLFLFFSVATFAQGTFQAPLMINFESNQLKDRADFHGMLLFGQDTFYLSKLPMYHKPHDYQAIMQVQLSPASELKFRKKIKRNGYRGIFTFEPDADLILPEAVTNKKSIAGMIWAGHFERGGDRFIHAEVKIVKLLYYKKLFVQELRPPQEKFFIFGQGKEYFIGHEITRRPDFDEIMSLAFSDVPFAITEELQEKGILYLDSLKMMNKKLRIHEGQLIFEPAYQSHYRETTDLE